MLFLKCCCKNTHVVKSLAFAHRHVHDVLPCVERNTIVQACSQDLVKKLHVHDVLPCVERNTIVQAL